MNSSQTAEAEVQSDWKREVNARLSAHRRRRGGFAQQPPLPGMEPSARAPKAARVAARVAERYAAAPSYREVMAAEAARAAEAAAQAAREAQQAADAVQEALRAEAEAESASEPEQGITESFELTPPPAPEPIHYRVDPASLPARPRQSSPILPQLHSAPAHSVEPHPRIIDPFEDALVAPAQPLPARVLEFPRELIAARKARPRYAEGPLREPGSDLEKEQLRIFECEPEAICHQPDAALNRGSETRLPEWCSIRLDEAPSGVSEPGAGQPFSARARNSARISGLADMLPLHVAPLSDRLLAAFVDMCLMTIGFVSFLMVFLACTPHPPTGRPALLAAAATFAGFILVYQWLFFTFAESTPGMRFARIALCTFDDENPDRRALRRRIAAACLATLPLGLGFLWAILDEDRLGWHDRMTRTYQRSYR